jgi:hypothetical protein
MSLPREGDIVRRILYLPLLTIALVLLGGAAVAADSKELKKQRQAAQKERQQEKNERSQAINEANRAFREFTRDLKVEYRERVKDLDTEFKLQRIDLKSDHDARVAGAQAEYQKKMSSLFMRPDVEYNEQTMEKLQAEGRAFADEMFALKKQSAEELQDALMTNEENKDKEWSEMDQMALEEAASLGLTDDYQPILATPLGDGLTKSEERWNEREKKEVVKLAERNRKTLSAFRNGGELRAWQRANMRDDFKLAWDEKAELHALDTEQHLYNALFVQAAQKGEVDQQKLMADLAEIGEKKQLVGIKYRKERDKERVRRGQEKKAILKK